MPQSVKALPEKVARIVSGRATFCYLRIAARRRASGVKLLNSNVS
jgi:hypothetical protein